MPMADIWKPNPAIAAYYDRIEDTATGGHCEFCQMVKHIFRDERERPDAPRIVDDPFQPLVIWQHASTCPRASMADFMRKVKSVYNSPKDR